MRRTIITFAALAAVAGSALQAQRPEGDRGAPEAERGPREGGPREGGRFGGPGGGRFQLPIMQALDADGDGELSDKEIENAAVALKSLDKDKNGKVSAEELRPNFGNFGRGPRGEARPDAEGRGAPREGRRPDAEGGAADRDGRRPGEEGAPAAQEGRRPGGGFGPPNPEDFANRALEFDADKDGKLSKEELVKMGEQFGRGFGRGRPGGPPRQRDGEPRRPQRPE